MRRIVHLSDLHFGRIRDELVTPLVDVINDLAPDLVLVSGDLTQRARVSQFADARRFLDRLEPEWLSVPGNHDTPLDEFHLRLLRPFGRYKSAISRDLEPAFHDDELQVIGVNTVNRFAWQRGKIGSRTFQRLFTSLDGTAPGWRIVFLHHPLEHMEETDKKLTKGAERAVAAMGRCGADIVLSGHLHSTVAAPFTAAPDVLLVQAGTSLSDRLRGEQNTFNLLTLDGDSVRIDMFAAGDTPDYHLASSRTFTMTDGVWR